MSEREIEELRERAQRCRQLAVGYDDRVGATLLELAEELEKRAAELEAEAAETIKIHPSSGNMR